MIIVGQLEEVTSVAAGRVEEFIAAASGSHCTDEGAEEEEVER